MDKLQNGSNDINAHFDAIDKLIKYISDEQFQKQIEDNFFN